MKQTPNRNTTQHTVTKAINKHIRSPELAVHSFRAMFGKQPISYYVAQRTRIAIDDRRDAELMRRLTELRTHARETGQLEETPTAKYLEWYKTGDMFWD